VTPTEFIRDFEKLTPEQKAALYAEVEGYDPEGLTREFRAIRERVATINRVLNHCYSVVGLKPPAYNVTIVQKSPAPGLPGGASSLGTPVSGCGTPPSSPTVNSEGAGPEKFNLQAYLAARHAGETPAAASVIAAKGVK